MAGLVKVREEDGSYSVLAAGQMVRGSMSAEEADTVLASLSSMEPDQD